MEKFFRTLSAIGFLAVVSVLAGCGFPVGPMIIGAGNLYNIGRYIHDDQPDSGRLQHEYFMAGLAREKEAMQNKPELPLDAIPGTGYLNTADEWHCLKKGGGILAYQSGKWEKI
jgi:hypothetical protein